jgi:hypothetical protein
VAKWVLDQWDNGPLDYPTLGFTAEPGDILDATAAPSAYWTLNGDQGAAETVYRYAIGSDPDYVEPTNGHVLTYSAAQNRYVPTAPETVGLPSLSAYIADQDANPASPVRVQQDARLTAAYAAVSTQDTVETGRLAAAKITPPGNAPVFAKTYGVVADGFTDDGPALAAAIAAAGAGGTVVLPVGNLKVTTPVQITTGVTLSGSGGAYTSRIYAVGCNGVEVASGVTDFRMVGMEVAASVRHTTTPNTYVGIRVEGATASRPTNHLYRDVYIDGFKHGILADYIWSSNFENVRTGYGLIGLHAYGKSVNNFVQGCSFSVGALAGSKGIAIWGRESSTDSTEVATEGWVIADTLTNGAEIGIDLLSANHISIHDCFIDFNMQYGIRAQSGPTVFATNYTIHDNYIAITGASGASAIFLANALDSTQRRHTRIHHNEILAYAGATAGYGINASGTYAQSIIEGNTLRNFTTADIAASAAGSIIRGNACLSALTNNIVATGGSLVGDNIGNVFRTGVTATSSYRRDSLGRRVVVGPAAPTTGDWLRGERVINELPAVGSPKAWSCTVSGTPGTWVSEGNL